MRDDRWMDGLMYRCQCRYVQYVFGMPWKLSLFWYLGPIGDPFDGSLASNFAGHTRLSIFPFSRGGSKIT
jgi:hypothetical protein